MKRFDKLKMVRKCFLALTSCVLILTSCNNETKNPPLEVKTQPVNTKPHINAPDFNSDSAFAYIKAQAGMGPRIPGSRAHEAAANYFEKKFKEYGAEVIIQKFTATTFDGKKWLGKNIIASFNPENPNRILLSAHWDSRPFCDRDTLKENQKKSCPGVNDGASGAGVLLEVARLLAKQKTKIGIDIILWDMEDYGAGQTGLAPDGIEDDWGLGSQYWSKNPHKPGYVAKYGILLDMVGGKNTNFPIELTSAYYAGQIQKNIWTTGQNLGFANYFSDKTIGEIVDDHLYINKWANIPCVDIIGYNISGKGFFPQHHTLTDDLNAIDKNTLKAVGQTLLEVIYNEQ
ncbi:MAG TPA: M28 family peptidase [Bacteroidia bacterium]|jgi:glutaminyl-peptide cyclotransferase|nr:M28 family peptidase [Bacteroidia bacterium]